MLHESGIISCVQFSLRRTRYIQPKLVPIDNVPQMLRIPGSEVKYFREKILQVLHVLAVFGLCVLRDTASTRSISGLNTLDTACT